METLLVLIFGFLLVSSATAGCADGKAGGDCSCTADVAGFITANSINGWVATCSNRLWSVNQTGASNVFPLGAAAFSVNEDYVKINGALTSAGAHVYVTVNAINSSQSGYLYIQGAATMSGFISFVLSDWDRTVDQPTVRIPFLRYASNNGLWTPYSPTLPTKDKYCYTVLEGAKVESDSSNQLTLEVALKKVGSSGCGGASDRGWVVAFIVILILWGAGLGLFALITCKIDSCYSMWWELK